MNDLFFLPSWPSSAGQLQWFALLLLTATVAGEITWRWLRLPRIIGYVAAGAALGPQGSELIDAATLAELRVFLEVAIGLILFELGQRVDMGWLRRNPWLLGTSLLEALLAFGAIFGVLTLLQANPLLAAVAAAIGIATSPAVALTVARDLRAQGQVTERLLLLTALNTVYAFVALTMLLAWLHLEYRGGWAVILLHPLYLIFGSVFLALSAAAVMLALLKRLGRNSEVQLIFVVAMVILAVTAASAARLSVAISLLAFGVFARALDRERHFVQLSFGSAGQIFVVILFAFIGANLKLALTPAAGFTALAVIAARFAGKTIGVFAFAPASALNLRKASLLSIGLVPMSDLAVAMVQDTGKLYPQFGPGLAAVVLFAVAILEVLGPLAAYFALKQAGEADEER